VRQALALVREGGTCHLVKKERKRRTTLQLSFYFEIFGGIWWRKIKTKGLDHDVVNDARVSTVRLTGYKFHNGSLAAEATVGAV